MESDEIQIDLAKYLDIIRRWLWLLILAPILAGAVGFAITLFISPTFEAEADVASVKSFSQLSLSPDYKTLSEAQLTQGLDVSARQKALVAIAHSGDLASTVADELGSTLTPQEHQLASLVAMVTVSADGDLIRIKVQNRDPQKAAKIAEAWANNFAERVNQLYTETPTTSDQVQSQVDQTWQNYQTAEAALTQFVGQNQIDSLSRDIEARQKAIGDLYASQQNLDRLLQDAHSLQDVVSKDPTVSNDLGNRLAMLLLRANAAVLSYSAPVITNPSSVSPNAVASDSSRSMLPIQVQLASGSLSDSSQILPDLQDLIASLEARRKLVESQLSDPSAQAQLLALQKQLEQQTAKRQELTTARDLAWSTYKTMASKLEEVKASQQATGTIVRIAGSAVVPDLPVAPRKSVNTVLAALAGLLVAAAVAFVVEFRDPSLRSSKDVAERLQLPVFQLRESAISQGAGSSSPPQAFYGLWANLFLNSKEPGRMLIVMSPDEDASASVTALNLGIVAAQSGRSVVLVDANAAQPSLDRLFDLSNSRGWSTAFAEEDTNLADYMQATRIKNLTVITSGPAAANLSQALISPRLPSILEAIRSKFDLVIFTCAPLSVAADALPLAKCIGGVLVVITTGSTSREAAAQLKDQLQSVGTNLLGVVAVEGTRVSLLTRLTRRTTRSNPLTNKLDRAPAS